MEKEREGEGREEREWEDEGKEEGESSKRAGWGRQHPLRSPQRRLSVIPRLTASSWDRDPWSLRQADNFLPPDRSRSFI